jgi:hypothetical protein
MIREVVLLPEMLQAGLEALEESRERGTSQEDAVIAVYLAMRGIEEIAVMREASGTRH